MLEAGLLHKIVSCDFNLSQTKCLTFRTFTFYNANKFFFRQLNDLG